MWTKKCRGKEKKKKDCPFLLLENSRHHLLFENPGPITPQGPPDFLSTCLGIDFPIIKKIGNIKGKFHARMGMIKDRNLKDITEAEHIKKRWQEYTEELYKKGLNDLDNHDAIKVLYSICQQIWKTLQWPQDWKIFILIPKKGNAKGCSNYCTIVLISHTQNPST